jgi:hypothetical protein
MGARIAKEVAKCQAARLLNCLAALVANRRFSYARRDMSFSAYLSTPFSHASEAQSFDALVKALTPECAAAPEPHYLIGNVMFDGDELDAIYLKPGCISVIEMKNYGGRVHFSENGDWYAGDVVVRGTRGGKPCDSTSP